MTEAGGQAVRDATADDVAAIAAIYNQGIEDRQATLETEPRSADERQAWLAERGARLPVLVGVDAGHVVGWASLNRFNPRAAYDHVADLSVYVDRAHRGHGVGHALLRPWRTERARSATTSSCSPPSRPTPPAVGCTSAVASARWAPTTSRGCSTGAG